VKDLHVCVGSVGRSDMSKSFRLIVIPTQFMWSYIFNTIRKDAKTTEEYDYLVWEKIN